MVTIPFEQFEVKSTSTQNEQLSDAKTAVSIVSTMMSYLLHHCTYHFYRGHPQLNTAAAETTRTGNKVWLDADFWESLSPKVRAFVIYHEVLHVFSDHAVRGLEKKYNPRIWAQAIDYYVDYVCAGDYLDSDGNKKNNSKVGKYIELWEHCYYDRSYVGLSADEIYEKLLEEEEKNGGQGGSGDGEQGNQDGSGGQRVLDHVSYSGDPETTDGVSQAEKNQRTMQSAVIGAKESNSIGDHEADIVREVMERMESVVNWKDHLRNVTLRCIPEDPTYKRVSRRSDEIIFPSKEGEHMNIVIGIDSSGSMFFDDICFKRCYSEMVEILKSISSWDLWLVTCDTKHHLIGRYSSDDGQDPESFDFSVIGGGGTDMRPILDFTEHLVHSGEDIDILVTMTDGWIPEETVDQIVPVSYSSFFLVTDNGNKGLNLKNHEIIFSN